MRYFYRFIPDEPPKYIGAPNLRTGHRNRAGRVIAFKSKCARDNSSVGIPVNMAELRDYCAGMKNDDFDYFISIVQRKCGESVSI